MITNAWLQAASAEASALTEQLELDPGDRWRLCVLVARLLGSPGGGPPSAALKRAAAVITSVLPPEPDVLLEALSTSLRSGDDPCAGLFDALLDIDDALAVAVLTGSHGADRSLVEQAQALVSIWPDRCATLAEFASMRLATLRADAPAARLWSEVAASPAALLADALPAALGAGTRHPTRVRQPSLPSPRTAAGVVRQVPFPRAALEARAWTEGDVLELGEEAWLSEENGQLHLEVRGATSASVAVVRVRDRSVLTEEQVTGRIDGRTFRADLGPVAGEETLIRRLLRRAQAAAGEVSVVLRYSRD